MAGKYEVPIWEKVALTMEEAVAYSNIGQRKLQDLMKDPRCPFILWIGKKRLIKRKLFEEYVEKSVEL